MRLTNSHSHMDKTEAIVHNERVIRNVMITLINRGFADPVRLIADKDYAIEQVKTYLEVANITREMLHMSALYLIGTNEID